MFRAVGSTDNPQIMQVTQIQKKGWGLQKKNLIWVDLNAP
jgi:hypothetical protein